MEKSFEERRRDPRLDTNIPIKIIQEEGDIVTETGNISRSGAHCCVSKPVDLMTKLKINLLLPIRKNGKDINKKISCEGVVVRMEPAADSGNFYLAIFFSDIAPRDAESITDYIASCQEKA